MASSLHDDGMHPKRTSTSRSQVALEDVRLGSEADVAGPFERLLNRIGLGFSLHLNL